MWYLIFFVVIIAGLLVFEFRFRNPDQIVLSESKGQVVQKKSRIFARHFNLPVRRVLFTRLLDIEAEAKGKLALKIKAHIAVSADDDNLSALVRAGGWQMELVENASQELIVLMERVLKEHCEVTEIERVSTETLSQILKKKIGSRVPDLGLKIAAMSILSVEPADDKIIQALQQQESARIDEETQRESLKAQITTARAEIETKQKIALLNHQLELKQIELKQQALKQESVLDEKRTHEEIKRRRMQLEIEAKEMALLKDNPEMLLLSPQMTRLAEASQSMKNARTIVSLSPNELEQGSQLIGMVQTFFQNMLQNSSNKPNKSGK